MTAFAITAQSDGRMSWDDYFINIAHAVSLRADCRRRVVGCVLVDTDKRIIGTGYNGAPRGMAGCLVGACPRGLLSYEQQPGLTQDYDNCIANHAEANALLFARTSCKYATAYLTDKPCPTCEKLLRGAGVSRVVWHSHGEERNELVLSWFG